ncbi:MAG: hypothetical protein GY733_04515, partial [bacterium]|nr:hypothetical protein [bacterium]
LEARSDTLDVTYLGRFSGVPNGSLMVARVERDGDGEPRASEEDPRPGWSAKYLQRVIQSDGDGVIFSQPTFVETADQARQALVRGATPVRGSDGSVVGVVLVSVRLGELLAGFREALPQDTNALLVTAEGASLAHPIADLAFARGESGDKVVAAAFPGLLAADASGGDKSAFGFTGDARAQYLSRFVVGAAGSGLSLTLVLAAPIVEVDLASPATLAKVLGPKPMQVAGAALAACVALLAGVGFVSWRRSRPSPSQDEAAEPSVLAERAGAIEAEAVASGELAADAEGQPQELPDLAAMATDEGSESDRPQAPEAAVGEGAEEEQSQAADGEPESALEEEPEIPAPQPEAAEPDDEVISGAPQVSPEVVLDSEPVAQPVAPRVSAAGMESARELATLRGRLEQELEDARRRALDELAAARERFEVELAVERERAIERLVNESNEALVCELGGEVVSARGPRRPAVEACEFDLRQLLTEVAAWMDGETLGTADGFGLRCNRNVPNRLLGDPEWVGPLLVNLGRSALRCSGGQPVELYVSCSDDGPSGINLCFELCAPETGLASDGEGRIHEYGGTGLELTQELVGAMQGDLSVERIADAACCVRVVLPMSLPS